MSETIRVSEEVYNELDQRRIEKESINDALKRILNLELSPLKKFKKELSEHYSEEDVKSLLYILKRAYIASSNCIFTYESRIESKTELSINQEKYANLIDGLCQFGILHNGKWCTDKGKIIAKELMGNYIDKNQDRLKNILNKYSDKIIGLAILTLIGKEYPGHNKDQICGYYTKYYSNTSQGNTTDRFFVEPLGRVIRAHEKIITKLDDFFNELEENGFAIRISSVLDQSHTAKPFYLSDERIVLPLEVIKKIEYIKNSPVNSISKAIIDYEILLILNNYFNATKNLQNTTQKQALVDAFNFCKASGEIKIETNTEDLAEFLKRTNKKGLTSELNLKKEPPIVIYDMAKLWKETIDDIGNFILDEI